MPFFVLYESQQPDSANRVPVRNVVAPKETFATREAAETGVRAMEERAARSGLPVPEFQIVEASTIFEAMSQFFGSPIPPPPGPGEGSDAR
jgi:hypothetical protein